MLPYTYTNEYGASLLRGNNKWDIIISAMCIQFNPKYNDMFHNPTSSFQIQSLLFNFSFDIFNSMETTFAILLLI